jgi:hypothetical protein
MIEVQTGEDIRAEDHNDLVRGLQRITYVEGPRPANVTPFPHPWKTRVEAGDKPGTWRVTMLAGFVNDIEATVAYLKLDDPRGWKKPDAYPTSRIVGDICERSWREPEDAPFLALDTAKDFVPVADTARPQAFRTADAWEKDLLVASVYLYSRPVWAFLGHVLPARYRTWAGRKPARPAFPFGVRELARVYVLRGKEPDDQQAFVKQVEFWDLAAEPVEPVKLLPDYKPIGGGFSGIGFGFADAAIGGYNIVADSLTQQVNAALENIAAGTSSVEFWTV